jgi:hypothetical protein
VHCKDGGASVSPPVVHAPFIGKLLESHLSDSFMKSEISHVTGLLYTIETFHEFHYPVMLSWFLKAGGLFHVNCFIFR